MTVPKKRRPPPRMTLPFGMKFDHAGPLNAKVHRIFTGLYSGDGAAALAELLSSDEPLDEHARAAVVRALESGIAGDTSRFRLKFIAPDDGFRTWQEYADSAVKRQEIADEFERLTKVEGLRKKPAYQRIIDAGLASSDRSIDDARKAARESLMRISRSKG